MDAACGGGGFGSWEPRGGICGLLHVIFSRSMERSSITRGNVQQRCTNNSISRIFRGGGVPKSSFLHVPCPNGLPQDPNLCKGSMYAYLTAACFSTK